VSSGIDIHGGAGGLTARFDDMLSYAGVLDAAGEGLRETSGDLGKLLVSGDLAEAAVLCPVEVATCEASLALAATGPDGALWTSGELEVTARLVRVSVETYREVDARLAGLAELGYDGAGFALGWGLTLPAAGLALGLAPAYLGLAQLDPELASLLRNATFSELQETLYENPWLEEALTRMAPALVQGGSFSLAALLGPAGMAALVEASGGQWPTTDYQGALGGLIQLAGLAGLLQDTGDYAVTADGLPHQLAGLDADHLVTTIFSQQGDLSRLSHETAHVRVIRVDGAPPSYIVQIPGTQVPDLTHGANPLDMDSNLHLMQANGEGPPPVIAREVLEAMAAAGIRPGDPVMLTGHSQGGIIAAQLAADEVVRSQYSIRSVVTGGSPIGRFDLPDDVSVLSLEHDQDVIPKLDGVDNPDRSNWVTVTRNLTAAEGTVQGASGPSLGGAHDTGNYAITGAEIDASTAASIERWREENAEFLTGGTGTVQDYAITPEDD